MTSAWNTAFLYANLADDATITASSYSVLLPPSLLQDEHVGRKWRSTSATTQYLTIDLGSAQSFDTVCLRGLNLTASGVTRVRVSVSDTTAQDGALYDSGSAAGRVDANYGTILVLLSAPVTGRYIRIDLSEPSLDYVQAGRAIIGLRTQVAINFSQGAQRKRISYSRKTKSRAGATFIDRNTKARVWNMEFQWLSAAEATGFIEAMEIANADDVDILVIRDPSSSNLGRDSIWGLLTELSPLVEPTTNTDIYSKAFQIEERL